MVDKQTPGQIILAIYATLSAVLIVVLTIADREAVVDLFFSKFKNPYAYLLFLLTAIFFCTTVVIPLPEPATTPFNNNDAQRSKHRLLRWISGVLLAGAVCWLLIEQFAVREKGMMGGDFGVASFNVIVHQQLTDSMPGEWDVAPTHRSIKYFNTDTENQKVFKVYYRKGIAFSGVYIDDKKKILNIKVQWIGETDTCASVSSDMFALGRNLNMLNTDVNDDAILTAHLLRGFIYLHACTTRDEAKKQFLAARQRLDTASNRKLLGSLSEALERYIDYTSGEKIYGAQKDAGNSSTKKPGADSSTGTDPMAIIRTRINSVFESGNVGVDAFQENLANPLFYYANGEDFLIVDSVAENTYRLFDVNQQSIKYKTTTEIGNETDSTRGDIKKTIDIPRSELDAYMKTKYAGSPLKIFPDTLILQFKRGTIHWRKR